MFIRLAFIIVAILNIGCTNAEYESRFRITTKRDNDKIEVKTESDKAVISVHSPFGISQAVIERKDKHWPETVMLRLHLKGLENFKVSNGKITLEAAVSSQDGTVRLWKDSERRFATGFQKSILDGHSLIGEDGKPTTTIPLNDGYFEMQLPKAFCLKTIRSRSR
jgi:hypothetical protein